jgi:hypothetical protein
MQGGSTSNVRSRVWHIRRRPCPSSNMVWYGPANGRARRLICSCSTGTGRVRASSWPCGHDPQTPSASVAVLARLGERASAEIDRRLRPLEEAGEKQVIIDIWVSRQLLNRPPSKAAERPTKLTKEASDELIRGEGRTCHTTEKSKGQAAAEGRNRPDHR